MGYRCGPCILVASVEMTLQERLQIEKGFLRPCADLLLSSRDKGNWQVWHNGGIIALGVALKNDSIINAALNKPDLGYYDMQKRMYIMMAGGMKDRSFIILSFKGYSSFC